MTTNNLLFSKILSEGYCCLHGYLRLCEARGENKREMAKFIGVHKRTIYLHFQAMREGDRPCAKQSDCMLSLIQEIEASSALPGESESPEAG